MIRLEVFTFDLHRLGAINKFSSISYTNKFSDVGTFELTCPVEFDIIELLKKDRILWIEDGVAGIIQYINKVSDDTSKITVKGNLLSIILDWRYVFPCFVKNGNPIDIMEEIVSMHCINTSNARKLPYLCIEHNSTELQSVTYQKTGGSVKLSCEKLSEANNIGYTILFNPRLENPLIFKVLVGTDHSVGNGNNRQVVFSQSLNNILGGEYTYNDENYRNVAFVAGEAVNNADDGTVGGEQKENVNRTTLIVDNSNGATGFYRKELYVDARDLQSEYTEEKTTTSEDGEEVVEQVEKVMSAEEYANTLIQRGNEKLSDCQVEENYQCQLIVDSGTTFRYGIDYNLGDKVTVFDEDINVRIDVTVTEMKVNYDKDGYTYEPVFGYDIPTILDKVRKVNVDNIS